MMLLKGLIAVISPVRPCSVSDTPSDAIEVIYENSRPGLDN